MTEPGNKSDGQHQSFRQRAWFGHFNDCGQRIDSYFADYMCLDSGVVSLWLNESGREVEDKLVATFSLANGNSVRRLLKSQLP